MTARTAWTLAGIALVVAALAAYRWSGGVEPFRSPDAPPAAADAKEAAPAPTPDAPGPAPAAVPLPRVLDFGRDT